MIVGTAFTWRKDVVDSSIVYDMDDVMLMQTEHVAVIIKLNF
jgi:hypothetical protein